MTVYNVTVNISSHLHYALNYSCPASYTHAGSVAMECCKTHRWPCAVVPMVLLGISDMCSLVTDATVSVHAQLSPRETCMKSRPKTCFSD